MSVEETVLISGGTRSFGKTMVDHLLNQGYQENRIFSQDEKKQDAMRADKADPRIKFYIGNIRNERSRQETMSGVDRVFHAAALKQVPSCEFSPLEAVQTNVLGSANVIDAAVANKVKSLVCLSTDKSVCPEMLWE